MDSENGPTTMERSPMWRWDSSAEKSARCRDMARVLFFPRDKPIDSCSYSVKVVINESRPMRLCPTLLSFRGRPSSPMVHRTPDRLWHRRHRRLSFLFIHRVFFIALIFSELRVRQGYSVVYGQGASNTIIPEHFGFWESRKIVSSRYLSFRVSQNFVKSSVNLLIHDCASSVRHWPLEQRSRL